MGAGGWMGAMKSAPGAPWAAWGPYPSAPFYTKGARQELGAQGMPGPKCPRILGDLARGPHYPQGRGGGAHRANPDRLRGGCGP